MSLSRRKVALCAAFVGVLGAGSAVTITANAAEGEFYDPAALNTSCVEPVDGLGKADRCRFEPWTKENFTGAVQRVSGDTVNCTDVNATKSIAWSHATTEENSIQVSVAAQLTLAKDIFSVSITATYGHSWSFTNTETFTEQAPVPARSVAWIERGAPMQRVTGRMVINYPKRRHGHYEWYTYPVLTNADPQALGFSTVILKSRPITAEESVRLCGSAPAPTQAAAAPSAVTLRSALPPATVGAGPAATSGTPAGG